MWFDEHNHPWTMKSSRGRRKKRTGALLQTVSLLIGGGF